MKRQFHNRNRVKQGVGNRLAAEGLIPHANVPLEQMCEQISRKIGISVPGTKNRKWEMLFTYAEQQRGVAYTPLEKKSARSEKTKKKKGRGSYAAFQAFYKSPAWRKLRYQALKLYGARCQKCGHTPESSGGPMHVDHIKPRSKYPELELILDNLQILCEDCNMGKGGWDESDWRTPEREAEDALTAEYREVMRH